MTQDPKNSQTIRSKTDFTVLMNNLIRSPLLSCKAYKLLSIGLSHADSWVFRKKQIATNFKEGAHTVDEAMKELRTLGYLHLIARRGADGKMCGHRWYWFDIPLSEEEFKKRYRNPEIPDFGDLGESENPALLRRTILKKTNQKEEQQPESSPDGSSVVVLPCLDEMKIPNSLKVKLSKELDESKATLLVKRVIAWKARTSDSVACNTILAKWDDWVDVAEPEYVKDRNRDLAKSTFTGHKAAIKVRGFTFIFEALNNVLEVMLESGTHQPKVFDYASKGFQGEVEDYCAKMDMPSIEWAMA